MKSRRFIILALLFVLVLALFVGLKNQSAGESLQAEAPVIDNEAPNRESGQSSTASADLPDPNDPRVTRLPDGRIRYNPSVELSRTITDTTSQEESLAVISQVLEHYRFIFQENPIGENSEITSQLLGNNPRKIIFIAPESLALHDHELTDSAGAPLFFHAQSASHMNIVSAGPDLELWTEDDLSTED